MVEEKEEIHNSLNILVSNSTQIMVTNYEIFITHFWGLIFFRKRKQITHPLFFLKLCVNATRG